MLNMDYYDRNGNKWSIEKGDWLSHQADCEQIKNNFVQIDMKGLILFILVMLVALSCFTVTV